MKDFYYEYLERWAYWKLSVKVWEENVKENPNSNQIKHGLFCAKSYRDIAFKKMKKLYELDIKNYNLLIKIPLNIIEKIENNS